MGRGPSTGVGVEALTIGLDMSLGDADKAVANELKKSTKKLASVFTTSIGAGFASIAAGAVGAVAALGAAMALTVGASSKFEDSFAGIKKTVNASDAEFKQLALSVRQLATEIPIATAQLNQIGELGGQLGVQTSGLPIFIDTIAKLGVATRLSTETAALSLARLQTIFQLPEEDIDNLASSLVDLGNNFAALEDEILSTALRLAAGAKVAGATVADTLAIATALQAVGVQSQAGGTAMARVFQAITVALQGGQKELQVFAQVTGLGVEGFKALASENPAEALNIFLMGLKQAADEGRNLVEILDELGLKQQRTIRALLAVSEAGDLLTDTLTTANIAYDLNIALQEEANKRFETAKSQTKLFKNAITELRIEIGNFFLPALKDILAGLTGTALAMGDNEKSTEGMSNALKAFVAIVTVASTAVMAIVGNLAMFRVMGIMVGKSTTEVAKAFASLSLATKGFATSAIFAGKAIMFLQTAMFPILAILAALTVGFMVFQAKQLKAKRQVEAFTKAEQARLSVMQKLEESQTRLNEAQKAAEEQGIDPEDSAAVQAELRRQKLLEENLEKLQKISNMTFLNIAGGEDLSIDEADAIVNDFDKIIGKREELNAIVPKTDAKLFALNPSQMNLAEQFAELFDIDIKLAEEIVAGGFDKIQEFTSLQSMSDPDAFKEASKILTEYIKSVENGAQRGRMGFGDLSEAEQEALEHTRKYTDGALEAAQRFGAASRHDEEMIQSRTAVLDQYNAIAAENENLVPIDITLFENDPETAVMVFTTVQDALKRTNENVEETTISATDLTNAFLAAKDAAVDLVTTIDDIDPPEIIDIDDIRKGVQMAKDLEVVLGSGVFQLLQAGYPALALDFAQGGIEAENMGKIISIVNSGIEENADILQDMEDNVLTSNQEIAAQAQNYNSIKQETLDFIKDEYGLSLTALDNEEDRAAIQRVFNSMEKESKADKADYLSLTKEVLHAERSIIDAKREIKDLEDEIAAMTADLVYDSITITNAKRDEVTQAEALAALNEALAEFGKEGVQTNSEKLQILQAELNIQRLTDKIENKRSKRQQKSIRDKKKEVEFLKKAVEQGVVDQLDLDVAQEELDDMQAPMDEKEKSMLTLQKEIAEAELEILKTRSKGLAPEVIAAIENYNKSLEVTAKRDEEIAKKTEEVARKTQDLQIEQAQVAERYDEILEKYPDFKEKSMEIASMIGIPQQVMKSALDGMGKTVDQFISYVNFAKNYRDKTLGYTEGDPNNFVNRNMVNSYEESDAFRSQQYRASEYNFSGLGPFSFNQMYSQALGNVEPFTVNIPPATETYTGPTIGNMPDLTGFEPYYSGGKIKYPQNISFNRPEGQQFPPYYPGESFAIQDFFKNIFSSASSGINSIFPEGFTPQFYMGRAYGGTVPIGKASVVGEMGPETIMSTPGGTSVFANKTGGYGSGVNIQNMNLNITGLPADPITARKVAQNIQRELLKLEKGGQAGTGLINR